MTQARQIQPCAVGVFLPASAQLVGTLGFYEALDVVNRVRADQGAPPAYDLQLLGVEAETSSVGGPVLRTRPSADVDRVHTVVIGGTLALADTPADPRLVAEVGRLAAAADRVVSLCVGAFVLGELGLLDDRRCTTHWLTVQQLADRFPRARVEVDAIYTEDGPVLTSAGATAGIDLALHLIRRDHGDRMARFVARSLVLFAHRPGGQSQFGAALRLRPTLDERLERLVAGVMDDPGGDHRVEVLAARVGMSPRHFARQFREQTGQTPAAFVAQVRVEAAQRVLTQSDAGMAEVAHGCGFGTPETLRRTFLRVIGVTPSAYRERFGVS